MKLRDVLSGSHGILGIELFKIGNTPISLMTLVLMTIVVAGSVIASRLLRAALKRALKKQGIGDEGGVAVATRLLHYLIVAIGLAIALQTAGVELGALFAAGAVFAVGIGFGMQNIAQNFVSGVILLIERTIKPGDVIEVESRVVKVQKMGIRATLVRSLDEEELIVPNSTLVQSTVKNFTLQDTLYRIRIRVGISYASDLKSAKKTLEEAAKSLAWRDESYAPRVFLLDFGASSLDLEVSVWMRDPWNFAGARSDLREAIWWAFKEHGITVAFPQLDLHLDPPALDAIAGRPKTARALS
jgi:small-conductance mechanosensitive channel